MLSLIISSAGVIGMLALWALAWWLWNHPATPTLNRVSFRRPLWHNEPTPKPRAAVPPPGWIFGEAEDPEAAPSPRQHPSSNAHTNFFSREVLGRTRMGAETTEILSEGELGGELEGARVDSPNEIREPTRLYGGPRSGSDT
jgi:hypothetical protein